MTIFQRFIVLMDILLISEQTIGLSYNQPKLSPNAIWNLSGVLLANESTLSVDPYEIFVDRNNTIYAANRHQGLVQVYLAGNSTPMRTIAGGLSLPISLFVTDNGDIYVDNGMNHHRVDLWRRNSSNGIPVMSVNTSCQDLFIDINEMIYCSLRSLHQIVGKPLNSSFQTSIVIAGTGIMGSSSVHLNEPHGIFVDIDLNLYVADFGNDRIQLFQSGQMNAITVAGRGTNGSITLNGPIAVSLDVDKSLFILEFANHRLIRSGQTGIRCLINCGGISSSLPYSQLSHPRSFHFDSYGHIIIVDSNHNRILKFLLATNSCDLSYNRPKLSVCAQWDPKAITFVNQTMVGSNPRSVYVDSNDTIYVTGEDIDNVRVWLQGNNTSFQNVSTNTIEDPFSVFVTNAGRVFVDHGQSLRRISQWTLSTNNVLSVIMVGDKCYGLFIDQEDNLYCSMKSNHQVIRQALYESSTNWTSVAGTGSAGSSSKELHEPRGIFVDQFFTLYVADCKNDRIQSYSVNELNGITVAGKGVSQSLNLNCPTGVILDADGYLFIIDSINNRIIRSGPNGFQCLFGCPNEKISVSLKLKYPQSLSFDSLGNLYVADMHNNRIQKYSLLINTCSISYNRPKLCSKAMWDSNATTLLDNRTNGTEPSDLFIDINNRIFVTNAAFNRLEMWLDGHQTPTSISARFSIPPSSVFVTIDGDIYIAYRNSSSRVDKWNSNVTSYVVVLYASGTCYDFFVDIDGNLYCSVSTRHRVIFRAFNGNVNRTSIVAGNGSAGFEANMLSSPRGIVVDIDLHLYVADCGNNRIQLFSWGNTTGMTVLGNGSNETITLNCPAGIVLDADGYLFIADYNNHRIIGSDSTGFHCLVGCSCIAGSTADQLNGPQSLNFDSYGNLFVLDRNNSRIQKFLLINDSCNDTILLEDMDTTLTSSDSIFTTSVSTIFVQHTVSSACSSLIYTGPYCNISTLPCDILRPCRNNATCVNNDTAHHGYTCSCLPDFDGTECQDDHRSCPMNTCWNNGTCSQGSNATFVCQCAAGWSDKRCQTMINYCGNVSCVNGGICQTLLMNYTCRCLSESYSGRFCQVKSKTLKAREWASKSVAFIAIIAMTSVAMFVIVLDFLKYCLNWKPIGLDDHKQKSTRRKKKTKPIIAVRFVYVNRTPVLPLTTAERDIL